MEFEFNPALGVPSDLLAGLLEAVHRQRRWGANPKRR